jgi:hypothetical protein
MWFLILCIMSNIDAKQPGKSLARQDCRRLITTHKLDDSVIYKAGVDTKGKKIPPADLPDNKTYGLGEKVVIPTELPLRRFSPNFPASGNPYVNSTIRRSDIYAGIIEIDKDGSVIINGEKVEDEQQEQIRQECKKKFPDLR